jgi:chromosome segregation protein
MKLNRLFLQGFKSFATQTEFLFSDGFTGVVGPNGCGKSNIVDSIKWVLGDRSAKSLRGEEMLDVIFNGGNNSPAANFAEVSLSFANNDKMLPLDYDEITITRRLYRTGESEYYINNQICRLKDIRELFMDTGVGMESYSIIEQGKVDFVLKASPTERRGLFEEAAGISKYKSKKKEAEGKLDKVQQDLLRLSDTTREIKSQIRSIKIQATKAQKYRQIAEEIKLKKANYFLHQYHQFITQRNEVSGLRTGLTQEIESLKAQINTAEDGIINFEKEIIAIDNQSRQEQNTLMAISSDISSLPTEIENNKKRREEVIEEESKAKNQLAIFTQQSASARQTVSETMHLLETTKQEYETLSTKIIEQENLLQELAKEEKELNTTLDAKRNEVFDNTHKKSQYQNELTEIQNELKNLSQRRDRCQARQGEIAAELNKLNETVSILNSGITNTQSQREQLKSELVNLEQILKSLKDDLTVLNGKIAQIQEEAHKKMARKEILEDLERHKEGLSNGVKEVLEAIRAAKTESPETQNKLSSVAIHGLLADLIKVESKYVLAIEAALDNIAQAIVTHSLSDSSRIIGYVKDIRKGKVITIATDAIKDNFDLYPSLPNLPGVLGKASQVVTTSKEFEPIVEWLLGSYILVENLDVALAVQANNQTFRPIVTLSGESITAEGIISGGGNEPGISVLSRKTELNTLIEDLKTISENLKIFQEQKIAKNNECLEIDGKCQHCRQDIYVQEINLLDKKKSLEEIQRRQELLNKEQEINQLETTETTNQINSLAERATSTAEIIKQIETRIIEVQKEIEELANHLNDYNERKKAAVHELTEIKISLTSASEKKEYLTSSISQLNSQIEQIEASLKATSEAVAESQARLKAIESGQAEAEAKLQTLSVERNKVEASLNELNQKIE